MSGEKERKPILEALLSRMDGLDILAEIAGEKKTGEKREEKEPADTFGGMLQALPMLMILPAIMPLLQQTLTQTLASSTVNVKVESSAAILPIEVSAATAIVPIEIKASDVTLNVNIAASTTTVPIEIKASDVTLNVNITGSEAMLNVNIESQVVNLKVIAPIGGAVSVQETVTRNDFYSLQVQSGQYREVTIATGKGKLRRITGQIFTTSSTSYVDWRNIRIIIYADGVDRFSAGGLSICSIDEATGAITINAVEGKSAGDTWIPYYPGRAFRIIRIKHGSITSTYDPTDITVNVFPLPFRELSFEIEMPIEFESSLKLGVLNSSGFSPTADIIVFFWAEWGTYP